MVPGLNSDDMGMIGGELGRKEHRKFSQYFATYYYEYIYVTRERKKAVFTTKRLED